MGGLSTLIGGSVYIYWGGRYTFIGGRYTFIGGRYTFIGGSVYIVPLLFLRKKSPARISGTGDRRFRTSGLCLKEILPAELVKCDKMRRIRNQSRRRSLNPGGGEVKRRGVAVAIGQINRQRGGGRLARNVDPEHAETAEFARGCADPKSFGRRARTHRRRVERNPAPADVFCAVIVASHGITSRG